MTHFPGLGDGASHTKLEIEKENFYSRGKSSLWTC